MGLPQNLEKLMGLIGLSGYQLHKQTGLAESSISSWLSGEGLPSLKNLVVLAQALGVTIDELVDGEYGYSSIKKPVPSKEDELKNLLSNKKLRTALEKFNQLTPESLDFALDQLDLILTHQHKK